MEIIKEKNNLVEKAGNALNEMIKNSQGKPLLLLLSGGSSLGLLEYIEQDSLRGITIGMLDDRYSYDHDVNSFLMMQGSEFSSGFFVKALDAGAVFLNSAPHEEENLEEYAERYELEIKKWMDLYPDGIIKATVGIGPDGHTSGILPFPEDPEFFLKTFNGEKLIVGYDVGNKNPHKYRMTSTFTFMRGFDEVLTYMSGENKKEALKKVLAEEGSLPETPGRIIRELKNVKLFTDIDV